MASPKWHDIISLSIYRPTYVSYLNITVSIYWCWQGKFPEYTHFVETSSTGCRDMLGHYGGKLCHRERGRCLARHQISHKTQALLQAPLSSHTIAGKIREGHYFLFLILMLNVSLLNQKRFHLGNDMLKVRQNHEFPRFLSFFCDF